MTQWGHQFHACAQRQGYCSASKQSRLPFASPTPRPLQGCLAPLPVSAFLQSVFGECSAEYCTHLTSFLLAQLQMLYRQEGDSGCTYSPAYKALLHVSRSALTSRSNNAPRLSQPHSLRSEQPLFPLPSSGANSSKELPPAPSLTSPSPLHASRILRPLPTVLRPHKYPLSLLNTPHSVRPQGLCGSVLPAQYTLLHLSPSTLS